MKDEKDPRGTLEQPDGQSDGEFDYLSAFAADIQPPSYPQRSYAPRLPTHNAGFKFISISILVSYLMLALLVMGIANNNGGGDPGQNFNWPFAFGVLLVALVLTVLSIWLLGRVLHNAPRRVVLDQTGFLVEDEQGQQLVEIPYNQVISLEEDDTILAEGRYSASFRGILVTWRDQKVPAEPRQFLLSARNTVDFDELMDDLFQRVPPDARGSRTFER
jgi:hypothetical protein